MVVFKYEAGHDHVFKVNGTSFEECTSHSKGLSSGHDVIFFRSTGQKWFIGDHCNHGQKLAITVLPPAPPARSLSLPPISPVLPPVADPPHTTNTNDNDNDDDFRPWLSIHN